MMADKIKALSQGWMNVFRDYEPSCITTVLNAPEPPLLEKTDLHGSKILSRTCLAAVIDTPTAMTHARFVYAVEALVILGHRDLVRDSFVDPNDCPELPLLNPLPQGFSSMFTPDTPWSYSMMHMIKYPNQGFLDFNPKMSTRRDFYWQCDRCADDEGRSVQHRSNMNIMRLALLATGSLSTYQWHAACFSGYKCSIHIVSTLIIRSLS